MWTGLDQALDARPLRSGRNVIECGINTIKEWRRLATCHDKLAIPYRGGAVLRAITLWLKRLARHLATPCLANGPLPHNPTCPFG